MKLKNRRQKRGGQADPSKDNSKSKRMKLSARSRDVPGSEDSEGNGNEVGDARSPIVDIESTRSREREEEELPIHEEDELADLNPHRNSPASNEDLPELNTPVLNPLNVPLPDNGSQVESTPRDHTPLSARRESRARNNGRSERIVPGSHGTESLSSLRSAINDLKVELLEVQRDKRVYSSHITALKEKCTQQGKDILQKNLQIAALEATLSSKRGSSLKNKSHVWSVSSLETSGIAAYQGIILTAARYAICLAKLVVTESYIDKVDDDNRKKDWTGLAVETSNETARKAVAFITFPTGILGIPTCAMLRAKEMEFFTSRFEDSKGFLITCIMYVLNGAVGEYMSEEEKGKCRSKIVSHRKTVQKFRAILSDAAGNRKKAAKTIFLRSLGYKYAFNAESKKDSSLVLEARSKEKESIHGRCTKIIDENLDTTYWRTTEWNMLCEGNSREEIAPDLDKAEQEMEADDKVDILFMNEPARRAFLQLRGYDVSEKVGECKRDAAILTLARADAYMTTMLSCITLAGKGGARNEMFTERFKKLIPKALAQIIKEIWVDIRDLAPHEFSLHIGNSASHTEDAFGNNLRDWTLIQTNPEDNQTYIIAKPTYFQQKACSWYGDVKDGQIGRYDHVAKEFQMITENMVFEDKEDSDVDDAINGVEESNQE